MIERFFGKDNCEHVTGSRHCPKCGKQLEISPLKSELILQDLFSAWLQRGVQRTAYGLFINPGHSVREYLRRDRDLLIKPVTYLALAVALKLWEMSITGPTPGCINDSGFICYATSNLGFWIQLFQTFILTLVLRYVFYRKAGYNFWEYAALTTYLLAQMMLIGVGFALLQMGTGIATLASVSVAVRLVYGATAVMQFFEVKTVGEAMKAIIAFLVGESLFIVFFVVAGVMAEL